MLRGETIVCIGNSNWFGTYAKSTVQILERLAMHNNVLFVEYPYTLSDLINKNNSVPSRRMLGLDKRLKTFVSDSNTQVYDLVVPPVLPVYFFKDDFLFRMFFHVNAFIYRWSLKRAMRKLKIKNPILITAFNPFYGVSMHRKLGEKIHIYYCYDGVESTFFGQRIYKYEESFSKAVDAIITTSDYLLSSKIKLNKNCFVVKNGVDFKDFSSFSKNDIHSNERKKVGYIGTLDSRFDIETVEYLIQQFPAFDFEFTGDMRNKSLKERLNNYSNVYFFDPVKPREVPALLSKYDVGIIPYLINDVNKNIYPLKINEYLAVGVPLVMNAFAELPEFEFIVSTAKNKFEFAEKLLNEIHLDNADRIKVRVGFASKNSWEERAKQFGDIIENIIS